MRDQFAGLDLSAAKTQSASVASGQAEIVDVRCQSVELDEMQLAAWMLKTVSGAALRWIPLQGQLSEIGDPKCDTARSKYEHEAHTQLVR